MSKQKILCILGLLFTTSTNIYATDKLISAPTGNLILDAGSSSAVKVNKTLQVDSVKNLAGTDILVGLVPTGSVLPFAGSTAPTGWVFAYGQEVSQTGTYANLYAVLGSTYCTTDHGGTCTSGKFRIPDLRGRGAFGKDNMGGTAANRITSAKTIDGTSLGGAGGSQTNTPVGINTLTIANHSSINLPAHYHGMGVGSTLSISIDHDHESKRFTTLVDGGHTHDYNKATSQQALMAQVTGPAGFSIGTWPITATSSDGSHNHYVDVDLDNYASSRSPTGVIGAVGCDGNSNSSCSITPSAHSITSNTFTGTEGNNLPPTVILNYIIKL